MSVLLIKQLCFKLSRNQQKLYYATEWEVKGQIGQRTQNLKSHTWLEGQRERQEMKHDHITSSLTEAPTAAYIMQEKKRPQSHKHGVAQ